jgi:hypothetical protein
LNQSPILRALSSIRRSGARTLLMGGQACVFYGAAEFSRDLDLLILADADNLARLTSALDQLLARSIAVPPLDEALLARGHAAHFRCGREDVAGLRVDIMASLRGVARFEELWPRRTTLEVAGEPVDLMGIEDLVLAKKTQRDKDWPMIRRLIEQSYFSRSADPTGSAVDFWLRELRTPELLVEAASVFKARAKELASERSALSAALAGDIEQVGVVLDAEEQEERRKDREYWLPLKRELEQLRLRRGQEST